MTNKDPSREAFEAWAIKEFISVNRSLDGTDGYFEGDSQIAWEAWQAALAMQMPEVEPVASFDDPRVQTVYKILCSPVQPPADEHWEGFTARLIADALATPADELDAAFEAVRKKLCKLPKFSFVIDREYGHVTRKQDDCGRWIEFDEVHKLFDPVAVDAAIAAQAI